MGASRIDLQVPLAEKDQAKRLGARWDPGLRLWYVPPGVDEQPLRKWIQTPKPPNIRAACYFLAESARECWRCDRRTRVFAIVLPAEHEVLDDEPDGDGWQFIEKPTLLSYIRCLPTEIAGRLRTLAPLYRIEFSQTTEDFYWMNHCEHCGAKQGDFDTIEEHGAPFNPATAQEAAAILLRQIPEPFSASCGGHTCGVKLFEFMQKGKM